MRCHVVELWFCQTWMTWKWLQQQSKTSASWSGNMATAAAHTISFISAAEASNSCRRVSVLVASRFTPVCFSYSLDPKWAVVVELQFGYMWWSDSSCDLLWQLTSVWTTILVQVEAAVNCKTGTDVLLTVNGWHVCPDFIMQILSCMHFIV